MKRFFRALLSAIFTLALLAAGGGLAQAQQTLYKYLDANGKTVYADKPPPPGVKYEKIQPNTAPTGVDSRPRGNEAEDVNAAIQARRAKQAEHDQRVEMMQRNYDAALAELEAGKIPQEGERTQNANGTSRLNDDYFSRIGQLQKKVDEARDALDAVRRE